MDLEATSALKKREMKFQVKLKKKKKVLAVMKKFISTQGILKL